MEKMERVKWTDKIRNEAVLKLIRKEKEIGQGTGQDETTCQKMP